MLKRIIKILELKLKKLIDLIIIGNKRPLLLNQSNKINLTNINRILFLRNDRIGDLLISSFLFQKIKEIYPNLMIDVYLSKKNIGAIKAISKYINHVYIYEKRIFSFIKQVSLINKRNYDLVIDLLENKSTTSSLILKLIKSKDTLKIGFDKENRASYDFIIELLNKREFHPIERLAKVLNLFEINYLKSDLVNEYLIENYEKENYLKQFPEMDCKFIGINIAGSNKSKFLGVEKNISLIKKIKEFFPMINIVLFGTNDYLQELNEIKNKTNSIIAPITNSFHQYAIGISLSKVLITTDTSAVHLASAFKVPTLVLFEINLELHPWTPFNSIYEAVYSLNKPIYNINPNDVFEKFKLLITRIDFNLN